MMRKKMPTTKILTNIKIPITSLPTVLEMYSGTYMAKKKDLPVFSRSAKNFIIIFQ
jgi:hypothetical protein